MVTQTPSDVGLYRINSYLLSTMTDKVKLSRSELHTLADMYLTTDLPSLNIEIPLDLVQMENDMRVLRDTMNHLEPTNMSVVPRIGHTHVRRQTFTTQTYVYDKLMEFEEVNLPEALGGMSKVHPWMFLECRMSYSNFLNKLSVRKQLFRLVLREKDQPTKNFAEILLSSNFMAGCRLHYNYNPEAEPRRMVDTHLTAVLGAIEDPLAKFNGKIVSDILSPGLPALIRTGNVKAIDITSLVNILAGDSNYMIQGQSLQQTLLHSLQTGLSKSHLRVDPLKLSVSLPESKFKSTENCVAWQRNVTSSHGNSGREIIVKNGSHYNHFLWGTRFELLEPDETDLDSYQLHNICTEDFMRVKLVPQNGFLIMAEYYHSDPIQIVSQTTVEDHQVRLYGRSISYDVWLLERLRGLKASNFITTTMFDYYQAHDNLVVENDDEIEEDSEVMADMDGSDLDVDMDDLLDGLSDIEMEDQSVKSSVSSEGEPSAPVSTQSSIRQPEGVIVNLASSSIRQLSPRMVEIASRNVGRALDSGFSLTLPVKMPITRIVDGETSAIRQLYDSIAELDELDRIWLTEYLDLSLLSYGPIKLMLEQTGNGSRKSSDDMEDW